MKIRLLMLVGKMKELLELLELEAMQRLMDILNKEKE